MSSLPLSRPPRSVCILRLSAIGDTTHMVPVVRAIQQQWPDCKITWVIGKLEYQLLQYLDGVEFISFDKSTGWQGMREFRRRMREREFDLLLHMQAALRASVLATSIRAPIKLGFDRARAIDYQWLFSTERIQARAKQHVLEGFLGFLQALGLRAEELDWRFDVPAQAGQAVQHMLGDCGDYIVINACSSIRKNNWRNWPSDRYAPVIEYASRLGLRTVLTGGPAGAEQQIAADIMQACSNYSVNHTAINLVGKTSLAELFALIRNARALIAPDTGPAHIASLANTPVIGLYASSNPLRTGPYRQAAYTVNKYPQAVQKFLGRQVDEVKWGKRVRNPQVMELIEADEVIAALDAALAATAAGSDTR